MDAVVDFFMHVVGFKTGAATIKWVSLGRISNATIDRFPFATSLLGLIEIFAIVALIIYLS